MSDKHSRNVNPVQCKCNTITEKRKKHENNVVKDTKIKQIGYSLLTKQATHFHTKFHITGMPAQIHTSLHPRRHTLMHTHLHLHTNMPACTHTHKQVITHTHTQPNPYHSWRPGTQRCCAGWTQWWSSPAGRDWSPGRPPIRMEQRATLQYTYEA